MSYLFPVARRVVNRNPNLPKAVFGGLGGVAPLAAAAYERAKSRAFNKAIDSAMAVTSRRLVRAVSGRKTSMVKKRKRGGKKKKLKVGKKKAKVSKKFRTKVLQAVQGTQFKGLFQYQTATGIASGDYANMAVFWDGHGATDKNYCILGTPLQVLNVASYLWNQKTWTDTWTTTTTNFPQDDFHLVVKSQTAKLELRNNTQRSFRVSFYECVSKNNQSQAPLTDLDDILNTELWTAAVPKPNRAIINLTSATSNYETRTAGTAAGANLKPELIPQWRNKWRYTKKTKTIQPGGTASYTVRIGELAYKAEKYTEVDGTIYRFQKGQTKAFFFRFEAEVSHNLAGEYGMQQFPATRPYFILKRTDTYHMLCPEHTSDIAPAVAGGPVIASNKQDVYGIISSFDLPSTETAMSRLDKKAPQTYQGAAPADAATNPT